jgi:uncharacterized RDD family membrane protein YckC
VTPPSPIDRLLGAIVPPVIDAVPVSGVIDQVDVEDVVQRIDVEGIVQRIDVDGLVQRVDVDGLVQRVDVDGLVQRVDVDGLVQRVDVQALVARVELDEVLAKVDMNALLDRVDIEALLARIDADALVQRIDVDALMQRVDLDALLARVDVETLMARANIDSIVRDASRGVFARGIDAVRRQIAGLDAILIGTVTRIFRRPREQELLGDGTVTGRVAGGVSRLAAWLIDLGVLSVAFGLTVALLSFMVDFFLGEPTDPANPGGVFVGGYALFAFAYYWLGLSITGRSIGKGIIGLKVVSTSGAPITPGRAAVRTIVYPLSFILGLGLIPIVLGKNRRALHDWAGRDKVLYDWGDRPAELPAPLTAWVKQRVGEGPAHDTPDVHDSVAEPAASKAGEATTT